MTSVPFADPGDTKVLTLRSILAGQPILFVQHTPEGGWHFLDGHQLLQRSDLVLVPLVRMLEVDPSLHALAELPVGWQAWRLSKGDAWQCESSLTLEKTLARAREALAALDRMRITLPPGSPSTTEMLREDRER